MITGSLADRKISRLSVKEHSLLCLDKIKDWKRPSYSADNNENNVLAIGRILHFYFSISLDDGSSFTHSPYFFICVLIMLTVRCARNTNVNSYIQQTGASSHLLVLQSDPFWLLILLHSCFIFSIFFT